MRVTREKAAQNRKEILSAAARLFRERGISATGVDSITKDVGLTHGAVYSQFGSKQVIAVEAIRLALNRSKRLWRRLAERKSGKQALRAIVTQYLSLAHRDSAGHGCAVAALGSEIARQPQSVRDAFTGEFKDTVEFLAGLMQQNDPKSSYEDAIAVFASLVGGLILARAVGEEALSARILKATTKRVIDRSRPRKNGHRSKTMLEVPDL